MAIFSGVATAMKERQRSREAREAYLKQHYPDEAKAPPLTKSTKLTPRPVGAFEEGELAEYVALAMDLGIRVPDIEIEKFKRFLREQDIPTYALREVTAYMDERAAKESKDKCGWTWRPLREKDTIDFVSFGAAPARVAVRDQRLEIAPASDFYQGPQFRDYPTSAGSRRVREVHDSCRPYDRVIPLHALRKVAVIEKAFGALVSLFVSDYALAPAVEYPDPFLMAVIKNPQLADGTGRFVIDFWDEPGFGIEQQLAQD